jgi:hypothetical protein
MRSRFVSTELQESLLLKRLDEALGVVFVWKLGFGTFIFLDERLALLTSRFGHHWVTRTEDVVEIVISLTEGDR